MRIDLGPGSSPAAQPGWNLFELRRRRGREPRRGSRRSSTPSPRRSNGASASTRAINLTTPGRRGARRDRPGAADAELAPTIFQIPTLPERRRVARGGAALPAARRTSASGRDRFPLLGLRGDHPGHQPGRPAAPLAADHRAARPEPEHLPGPRGDGRRQDRPRLPRAGRHPRPARRQPPALRPPARRARRGPTLRPRSASPSGSSSTRCRATTAPPRATSPRCWSRARSSGCGRCS